MSINLPTLKQLRYLVTLRDTEHFSRAAEQCHVTQSTLSAGLAELENVLDVKLVERSRRGVFFTPLGEEVVRRARDLLADAEAMVDVTLAAQRPLTGTVRMGVIPTIAPFFLPAALPPLRDAYPELKLRLTEATSQTLCDRLHAGTLDVVLYALPYRCGEVEEAVLFDDPFVAAFPGADKRDGAPLPASVDPDAMDSRTLLLLEEGHCLRDHALAACSLPDVDHSRSILATSLHTLVQMVDNGLGVTLLPQLAIDGGILNGTAIETVPLDRTAPPRLIGLVWRKASPRSEEFRLLARALQACHEGQPIAAEVSAA
ncbi:LysR family transcriptional regulator [Rhodothalassium salexigens]|uniref:hydrogen peroxide-inducible genes activator n=1 Tax=Rhodothalassium salexigens TaxID=1086 RepID=UPI0023EE7FF8|nr:hydrogen peroxide-inducible genes activator [Rhodothalassium salexigens]MBK5912702.1 LysR family transcriptional regulator [Rhodothalassium salexigens]